LLYNFDCNVLTVLSTFANDKNNGGLTMNQAVIEQIRSSSLSDGLSDDECAVLAEITSIKTLADDEVLITEGHTDDCLYAVLQGKVGVTKLTGGGAETTLHILSRNDFAGQMGFVDGMKHTATLKALGSAQVLALHRDDLESRLQSNPHLVYQIMRTVVRSGHDILRAMNNQYVELTNYITKTHGRY
jgi:CRP-like cAMP-binding protein